MGVGAHSVTSRPMVALCGKGQKKPKINIRAKQQSSMPNWPQKSQKGAKKPNQKFQGRDQKRPNLTYLALRDTK